MIVKHGYLSDEVYMYFTQSCSVVSTHYHTIIGHTTIAIVGHMYHYKLHTYYTEIEYTTITIALSLSRTYMHTTICYKNAEYTAIITVLVHQFYVT